MTKINPKTMSHTGYSVLPRLLTRQTHKLTASLYSLLLLLCPVAGIAFTSTNGLQLNLPNGFGYLAVDDLQISSSAARVRWTREWNGKEWKFNPQWESLSQSWTNLTGSHQSDTRSAAGLGNSSCWIWVDEDLPLPDNPGSPLDPQRLTPFNRSMTTPPDDYAAPRTLSLNRYALCPGMNQPQGIQHQEGLRRINELHLGENGNYHFSNRSALNQQAVEQLPIHPAATLTAALQSGSYPITPISNPKGYRWQDREGNWIHYNTQGQVIAWGDPNGNRIWLARDDQGILHGVVDDNGQVLYTLHYNGPLLTEIRDYPQGAEDLPSRSIHYQYDSKNRLTQITDPLGHTTTYTYDDQHRLTGITDAEGRQETLAYQGNSHEIKRHTAADGGQTDYTFDYDDAKGQFISTTQGPESEAGRKTERQIHHRSGKLIERSINGQVQEKIIYDEGSRTQRITNARGYETRQVRNEFDQIIEIQYPDGGKIKRSYSALHLQLLEETDELGIKTQYDYDAKGNLLKKTEAVNTPDQRVTEYTYNSKGQLSQLTQKGRTENNGTITPDSVWKYQYTPQGQISQETDPEGNTRHTTYDRAGNPIHIQEPTGTSTRLQYDAAGRLTQLTDPLGRETHTTHDKVGNPTTQTDPKGQTLKMAYDALNRRTEITSPTGGTQKRQYNGQGQITQNTDADGKIQKYTYDPFERVIQHTDGLNPTQFTYLLTDGTPGSLGAPIQVQYPTFNQDNRYDERERPTTQTLKYKNEQGEQSNSSSTAYNRKGQVTEETDSAGQKRRYQYNALGQLSEVTDTLGNTTKYQYNAQGRLLQLTDPKGQIYSFDYDKNGRVIQETLPLGQSTIYAYDANGNLTTKTDPEGNITQTTYDAGNRPIETRQIQKNGTTTRTLTQTWDANDNLTAWADTDLTRPAGQQQSSSAITYDNDNRKTKETITYPTPDGSPYSLSYSYAYSPGGKKTRLTWPDGTEISYGYNGNRQLESVTLPGEGTLSLNEYNWLTPKQITLPGGGIQKRSYDGLLNLESLEVKTAAQQTRLTLINTYGPRQELTQRTRTDTTENSSSTVANTYQYDPELRLIQAVTDTGGLFGKNTETFTLDQVANRTQHSKTSGEWQYDQNNRLKQKGSGSCGNNGTTCYQWDKRGNLTEKQEGSNTTTYRYDSSNRLTEVRYNHQLMARYGYDPFNRRLWKEQYRDKQGNSKTQAQRTYYLYSDEGLIGESTQAITVTGETVTANAAPEMTTQYGPTPDGLFSTHILFAKTKNTNNQPTIAYYHYDHLSTPMQATDKEGNVVWSANYEAFGKATITTPNPSQEKPTITSNLRFPGQYEDEETGLHYNFNRYYDAETGRYITQDPIGLKGGINQYAYVKGNPVHRIDINGERYSDHDCQLLSSLIADQWKVFWLYFDIAITGEKPSGISSGPHSVSDCQIKYLDEGRRLVCEAHERTHRFWHFLWLSTYVFDRKEAQKRKAQLEMEATMVGIKEGERLYKENCGNCE